MFHNLTQGQKGSRTLSTNRTFLRNLRRTATAAIVAAATCLAIAPASGASQSEDDQPTPNRPGLVEVAMYAHHYDATVAEKHGYEIRTLPDGTQYSVKKGTPPEVVPMDVVHGNCGYSWMWIEGIGNSEIRMNTGFAVRDAVSTFSWTATLYDMGGTTKHDFPPHYDADGFVNKNRIIVGLTHGPAEARVLSPFNFAILVDGTVCFSGTPIDTTNIY